MSTQMQYLEKGWGWSQAYTLNLFNVENLKMHSEVFTASAAPPSLSKANTVSSLPDSS